MADSWVGRGWTLDATLSKMKTKLKCVNFAQLTLMVLVLHQITNNQTGQTVYSETVITSMGDGEGKRKHVSLSPVPCPFFCC